MLNKRIEDLSHSINPHNLTYVQNTPPNKLENPPAFQVIIQHNQDKWYAETKDKFR